MPSTPATDELGGSADPRAPVQRVLRDLRASRTGLSEREAARRLVAYGPNELARRGGLQWPRQVVRQLVPPLALLLWLAALLSYISGSATLAAAIVAVILLNTGFAFLQERYAERAVEALSAYLPPQARVLRDGEEKQIQARQLVPGAVLVVREGDRVSAADARLLEGSVEMDVSTLTEESLPVSRSAEVWMRTELGRIAALSERVGHDPSPLEKQVTRVARIITVVAVAMGIAFIPVGTLLGGLSLGDTLKFAIGLLVANVPEGLLPTITLALAVGVRVLARRGPLPSTTLTPCPWACRWSNCGTSSAARVPAACSVPKWRIRPSP
ncbi:HAD-IC family P-type ATPase [Arthrobacter sp. SRS-W-1-2016]|uniref:HAD-IC family P-type ATPase n=1 Tax=Arthrobacter sp. SRS-W-1-2016 TaxID=1930254 RepID=UPI001559971F|nr:HAD-IC family P-type ATPase [Arthrobacter sp. SRS-W-1-2016]